MSITVTAHHVTVRMTSQDPYSYDRNNDINHSFDCPTCRNEGTFFRIALVQVTASAKDSTFISKILSKYFIYTGPCIVNRI